MLSLVLRSVPNVNQTVVEPAFIEKLELHSDVAWQVGIAAARDDGRDEEVIFVNKASPNGMRCKRRTAHRHVASRSCLELPHNLRLEIPLEPRLGGRDRLQRPRVDDLFSRLPDRHELQ